MFMFVLCKTDVTVWYETVPVLQIKTMWDIKKYIYKNVKKCKGYDGHELLT